MQEFFEAALVGGRKRLRAIALEAERGKVKREVVQRAGDRAHREDGGGMGMSNMEKRVQRGERTSFGRFSVGAFDLK